MVSPYLLDILIDRSGLWNRIFKTVTKNSRNCLAWGTPVDDVCMKKMTALSLKNLTACKMFAIVLNNLSEIQIFYRELGFPLIPYYKHAW